MHTAEQAVAFVSVVFGALLYGYGIEGIAQIGTKGPGIIAVDIPDGNDGLLPEGHHNRIAAASHLIGDGYRHVFAHPYPVADFKLAVCTSCLPLNVGIDQCALLIEMIEREKERTPVATAAYGKVVVGDGRRTENLLVPIRAGFVCLDDAIKIVQRF